MKYKLCSKCKKKLPITDFYKDRRTKDGLYSNCKKCSYQYTQKWAKENPKKVGGYQKEWIAKNPEKHKYFKREHQRKRRMNIRFRLDGNLAATINHILKGQKAGRKWQTLVGYTTKNLMKHLERQFDKNMTWDNYGSYWEVDHIKPKILFRYNTPEDPEFKKCWALENLQPLEKSANRKKHDKFENL